MEPGPSEATQSTIPYSNSSRERLGRKGDASQPARDASPASDATTNVVPEEVIQRYIQKSRPIRSLLGDDVAESDVRIWLKPSNDEETQHPPPDSDQWKELDGEGSVKYLAVTQPKEDVRFVVQMQSLSCHIYFDPSSDSVFLLNMTRSQPIRLRRLEDGEPAHPVDPSSPFKIVMPRAAIPVYPASWCIYSMTDEPLMDFCLLPRRHSLVLLSEAGSTETTLSKRNRTASPNFLPPTKAARAVGGGNVRTRRGSMPSIESSSKDVADLDPPKGGALDLSSLKPLQSILEMSGGQKTIVLNAQGKPEYSIFRMTRFSSSRATEVFTARHSSFATDVVVVKIMKPHSAQEAQSGRDVMKLARDWENEYQIHKKLQSDTIVKLIGGDSRFFAIFLEYIDDRNLHDRRDAGGNFTGTRADATRVLRDMADALLHLREHRIIHNDIKPRNIMYGRRGAVLIDFGLSSQDGAAPCIGGTPWYVGPELIQATGKDIRGHPSDIWALGVVMMYLLRMISLPEFDLRAKEWIIRDAIKSQSSARASMERWVEFINGTRSSLDAANHLDELVYRMLDNSPASRIEPQELHTLASLYFGVPTEGATA